MVITNGTAMTRLLALDYLLELPALQRPNFNRYASPSVEDPDYDPGNRFTMAW